MAEETDLERFVEAQARQYETAIGELGLILLVVANRSEHASVIGLTAVGAVYALLAVLGFAQIGEATIHDGAKRVRYLERRLSA